MFSKQWCDKSLSCHQDVNMVIIADTWHVNVDQSTFETPLLVMKILNCTSGLTIVCHLILEWRLLCPSVVYTQWQINLFYLNIWYYWNNTLLSTRPVQSMNNGWVLCVSWNICIDCWSKGKYERKTITKFYPLGLNRWHFEDFRGWEQPRERQWTKVKRSHLGLFWWVLYSYRVFKINHVWWNVCGYFKWNPKTYWKQLAYVNYIGDWLL